MAERAFIHRPFDGHITMKPQGVILARIKNGLEEDAGFVNGGNYENASYQFDFENEDIYTPQTAVRSIIGKIKTGTITVSLEMSQLVPSFLQLSHQSKGDLTLEQAAVTAQEFVIPAAQAGRVYRLPHRQLTAVMADDADGTQLKEGINYQYDAPTGHFEIIAHPGMVEKAPVTITYSAAAITGRKMYGMMSDIDLRCEFMFRSTNKYGPKQLIEFWDMQLEPDGENTMGSNSTDSSTRSFTGTVYADPSKPEAFQYGQVTDLG